MPEVKDEYLLLFTDKYGSEKMYISCKDYSSIGEYLDRYKDYYLSKPNSEMIVSIFKLKEVICRTNSNSQRY